MDNYERFGPARQVILLTSTLPQKEAINQGSDAADMMKLTNIAVILPVGISRVMAVISGKKRQVFSD